MEDNFDIRKWNKERYLAEATNPKDKEEEAKIGDNLYKKVTGEEPKVSTKNKVREPVKESPSQKIFIIGGPDGELYGARFKLQDAKDLKKEMDLELGMRGSMSSAYIQKIELK